MARHTREGRKRLAGRCLFCPEAAYEALDAHRHVPGAAGGRYRWENVVPACASCHRKVHAGLIVVHERRLATSGRHVYRCTVGGVERWLTEPSILDPEEPRMTTTDIAAARYATTPLPAVVRDLCYRVGDFTLASGAKSNEYVDVKTALLHPYARRRIAEAVLLAAASPAFRPAACVAGPELGAIPLAVAVSDAATRAGRSTPALMVRKKGKDHGTKTLVDGLDLVAPGATVLLVEDVFTTGGSSAGALETLLAAGLNPVGAICVVDRGQGADTLITGTYGVPVARLMTIDEVRNVRHDCMEYRPSSWVASQFSCPVCGRRWRASRSGTLPVWDEVYLHDATQLGLPGVT